MSHNGDNHPGNSDDDHHNGVDDDDDLDDVDDDDDDGDVQVLKIQLRPHHVDIENLNQYMADLTSTSPFMAEALMGRVSEINERWQHLLKEFEAREVLLITSLLQFISYNYAQSLFLFRNYYSKTT